jgi:ABC-type uncharacterized transport system permease subunit
MKRFLQGLILGIIFAVGIVYFLDTQFWIGFVTGIITGVIANILFDWAKNVIKGNKPYIETNVSEGMIKYKGQINYSSTGQAAIQKLIKSTGTEDTRTENQQ